jgi:hypothetical protein
LEREKPQALPAAFFMGSFCAAAEALMPGGLCCGFWNLPENQEKRVGAERRP